MALAKDKKLKIKDILKKVFSKQDNAVFHLIKSSKKEFTHQYQILIKTRKTISPEKIKVAQNLIRSEFVGESWDLRRWSDIIGKIIPKSKVYKIPFFDSRNIEEISPWRLCPIGEHWVVRHTKDLKSGKVTDHDGHCRLNPKGKDLLKTEEMRRISELEIFKKVKIKASENDLGFDNDNKYNELINGWCEYWNQTLKPPIPLHPNYVKALIATESGFNESPPVYSKNHKASGLMQIMPKTVGYLNMTSKDIKDHYIDMTLEDAKDPNIAIAAAIRWLFRKHRLVSGKRKNSTWMDSLEEYKGIINQKGKVPKDIRFKFNKYFNILEDKKK